MQQNSISDWENEPTLLSLSLQASQAIISDPPTPTGILPSSGGLQGFSDPAWSAILGILAVTALIKALTELVKACQD